MSSFCLVMAQINPLVGDIEGNTSKVIESVNQAKAEHDAALVVFPELTLTGYPPEDLLLRPSLAPRIDRALERIKNEITGVVAVVGYPKQTPEGLQNVAGAFCDGKLVAEYAKQHLPNYQVFDEKRYFVPGDQIVTFEWQGHTVALSICEDIWYESIAQQSVSANASLLLNLNASPFHRNKQAERESMLAERAVQANATIVYVNQVGGQDELVFDGGSLVVDPQGKVICRAEPFDESLLAVEITSKGGVSTDPISMAAIPNDLASIYGALVLGVRDYVNKNGFKGAVIGLSGGIDSALTLAVAVDALGADRVEAVMMPFKYTSDLSKNDAADQAERMGVRYQSINIESIYGAFTSALAGEFSGLPIDKTEENIQARSRGVLLMAISNKKGSIVLTTGNKSEMSVGYATLYGDMAGGYAVLKDVPKITVFDLARYRNTLGEVIPDSVITRPPSAELAPDQIDEDSLPPYEILDQILELYIEKDMSAEVIAGKGFDESEVRRVLRMVDINEYKRRQSAIGVRITQRGFGRDRRYPITNGWVIGD